MDLVTKRHCDTPQRQLCSVLKTVHRQGCPWMVLLRIDPDNKRDDIALALNTDGPSDGGAIGRVLWPARAHEHPRVKIIGDHVDSCDAMRLNKHRTFQLSRTLREDLAYILLGQARAHYLAI
eukprot:TRINITY_DN61751_c0_g1_i1.p1 TRINITY_DN61751_c0_g1~~TRINITY_DN61751_c0_g1_i1.p1  ORF type:complete len:122 (+),score=14.61 TRINITY_DN61751_c0_g1_i1:3-368(+)